MIHLQEGDVIYIKTQEQLLQQHIGTLIGHGTFQPYNSTHYPNVVTSKMYGIPIDIDFDQEIDETDSREYIATSGCYNIHTWMIDWSKSIHNLKEMAVE